MTEFDNKWAATIIHAAHQGTKRHKFNNVDLSEEIKIQEESKHVTSGIRKFTVKLAT